MRKVIAFLEREFGTSLAATVRAASEYHLLTDGTNLYLRTSARQVVDLLKNSFQPMFDICLSDEVRRVRGELVRGEILSHKAGAQKKSPASERARPPVASPELASAQERWLMEEYSAVRCCPPRCSPDYSPAEQGSEGQRAQPASERLAVQLAYRSLRSSVFPSPGSRSAFQEPLRNLKRTSVLPGN
jgi:hypothetical protein